MKTIITESHVPFIGDAFTGVAKRVVLPPEEITSEAVKNADAMIVRTRTRCDASLLDGSKIGFVATATIGTDHIDAEYCRQRGIEVVSAPGCNAPAVAQYVWASILRVCSGRWRNITLGVVGCGHVGSIVTDWATSLGVKVMVCDPPRRATEGGWQRGNSHAAGSEPFWPMEMIMHQCDVITFHTPHTLTGKYATHHLAGHDFFMRLSHKPVIINAARGPIVDTPYLIEALETGAVSHAIIDCWEGEPKLDRRLLDLATIATPHIAGYSIEGKMRATAATVTAALRFLGSDRTYSAPQLSESEHAVPQGTVEQIPELMGFAHSPSPLDIIASYDPFVDTAMLRANPQDFEMLRDHYALRHEVPYKN